MGGQEGDVEGAAGSLLCGTGHVPGGRLLLLQVGQLRGQLMFNGIMLLIFIGFNQRPVWRIRIIFLGQDPVRKLS